MYNKYINRVNTHTHKRVLVLLREPWFCYEGPGFATSCCCWPGGSGWLVSETAAGAAGPVTQTTDELDLDQHHSLRSEGRASFISLLLTAAGFCLWGPVEHHLRPTRAPNLNKHWCHAAVHCGNFGVCVTYVWGQDLSFGLELFHFFYCLSDKKGWSESTFCAWTSWVKLKLWPRPPNTHRPPLRAS